MKKILVAALFCIVFICSCGKKETEEDKVETMFFGTYEQDNVKENGEETIEWTVIDEQDDRKLLICSYDIDCKQMVPSVLIGVSDALKKKDNVDWDDSLIREWLNGEFFEKHFTEEEKARILDTEHEYIGGRTEESFKTYTCTDKIFYLSLAEAKEYYEKNGDSIFGKGMTELAFYNTSSMARLGMAENNSKMSAVCTRDKADREGYQEDYRGSLFWCMEPITNDLGEYPWYTMIVGCGRNGVRPAMWISTSE